VTATATGEAVIAQAEVREIRSNIFVTLAVALVAMILLLAAVYRLLHGSATQGAITGLDVVFVLTYVFAAMKLPGVPLTLFTALMVSLAVRLGIDYSIHVTHRHVKELDEHSPGVALRRTAAGTGGALLGSTATTVGAFGSLSLATFPQFRNVGILVALSLVLSLITALVVIPAFLVVWTNAHESAESGLLSRGPVRGD
jgi:predicted RND superfamily exporter protein